MGLADIEELTHVDRPDLLYPPPDAAGAARDPERAFDHLGGASAGYPALSPLRLLRPGRRVHPGRRQRPRGPRHQADPLSGRVQLPHSRGALGARGDGKQVAVLVELKARFDEEPNITWARRSRPGACTSPTASSASRRTPRSRWSSGARVRASGATSTWARATTTLDGPYLHGLLGYFTDDPTIAEDVSDLFNYLTGYSEQAEYHELLVAPCACEKASWRLMIDADGEGPE